MRSHEPSNDWVRVIRQPSHALGLVAPPLRKARKTAAHIPSLRERWFGEAIKPLTVDTKLPAPVGLTIVVMKTSKIGHFGIQSELRGVGSCTRSHLLLVLIKPHFNIAEPPPFLLGRQRFDDNATGPSAHPIAVHVSFGIIDTLDSPTGACAVRLVCEVRCGCGGGRVPAKVVVASACTGQHNDVPRAELLEVDEGCTFFRAVPSQHLDVGSWLCSGDIV